jgi:hypothetical protein
VSINILNDQGKSVYKACDAMFANECIRKLKHGNILSRINRRADCLGAYWCRVVNYGVLFRTYRRRSIRIHNCRA